ncbi:MAG: surface antigen BspA-like [Herbinix sp.]|jgi:hypothetical protein|nr:surface antigen BspA-like [Herbinix sp.]
MSLNKQKQTGKRYLRWILTGSMLLLIAFISTRASRIIAAEDDFLIKNGTLIKYRGNSIYVTIPDTVTWIGNNAFERCNNVTYVTMPDTVTGIGDRAFENCDNMKEINIPHSVTKIGDMAFAFCDRLERIILPDSVTKIGDNAFYNCNKLKNIQIPSSVKEIGKWAFQDTAWLAGKQKRNPLVIINGILIDGSTCEGWVTIPDTVNEIGDYAFYAYYDQTPSRITEVDIPASVQSIGEEAFNGCKKLKKLRIPDSVDYIGEQAFADCTGLTEITIPDKVTAINYRTFDGCSRLKNIIIPDSVTEIGVMAFSGCKTIEQIVLPASITGIGDRAFYKCSGLKSITIPNSVINIGKYAFGECTGLKKIEIPKSVLSIGDSAFLNCSSLSGVRLTDTLISLGYQSFEGTPWLNSMRSENPLVIVNHKLMDASTCQGNVVIPEGVTEITKGAFQDTKIINITIPSSVSILREEAFLGCDSLTAVILPEGVKQIGDRAFRYCSKLKSISISSTVESIGKNVFDSARAFKSIQVSAQNPYYSSYKKMLFNKDKTVLLSYSNASGEITIPEGVKEIAEGAFSDHYFPYITKVKCPSTLVKIADHMFDNCLWLEEISIPSSLESLGEQMFYHSLKHIEVYPANQLVNYINVDGAIYNPDMTTLYCNLDTGDIVIADSVTTIESYAFPCVRKSVTIHPGVTSLGLNIFVNEEYDWTPANEDPLFIYGIMDSRIEEYCLTANWGVEFLALDGNYTVYYDLDGGINTPANPRKFTRNSNTMILQKPTKKGYEFLYWYEDISLCEDGCCRGERIIEEIPKGSLGDIELHAKWKKIK